MAKVGLPRPLRIVFLDHTGEFGGAEHLLLILLNSLPKNTIDPLLICGESGPFPDRARRLGINTLILSLPKFSSISLVIKNRKLLNPLALLRNLVLTLWSVRRLRAALEGQTVDLIQTNSMFSHIIGGIWARQRRVPCVWLMQDMVERRRMAGLFSWTWRVLASTLVDQVVGVSHAALEALGLGRQGCVIYPGHREGRSELTSLRHRLNLPQDAKLVGFVGRIAYVKGLDVLARAAREVIREDPRVHFVVIGSPLFGEQSYHKHLEGMIHAKQLGSHWFWHGYDDRAPSLISEFDLLVLPSRREGFPLALLEAGMARKPAVASRVGGIPEIIVDGQSGILVPPEDSSQLARGILKLTGNPEVAAFMGIRAHERVKRLFHPSRFKDSFLSLYDSLTRQCPAPSSNSLRA